MVVQEDRFILSNIEANNNKFWRIERTETHHVTTYWGRVGETGDRLEKSFTDESSAIRFYEKICREKQKKGYVPQKVVSNGGTTDAKVVSTQSLAEIATEQIETSSQEVVDLIKYLTQANIHQILTSTTMQYDTSRGTFSTPLGIVTKEAIDQARDLLAKIGDFVAAGDLDNSALIPHLNQYLMLIPQDIGRQRPSARTLYPNVGAIQRQNDILDSLDASLQSVLSRPATDTGVDEEQIEKPKLFEVKLHTVEDGKEIDRIRKKYRETQQSMHGSSILDVSRVYMVEIGSMRRTFESEGLQIGNVWELWHGSKKGNLLSIMSKGFVIPPRNASYCTGRMFGNGVYFSDQSTKSLNYAWGYWDGQRDDNCFMFLCNVAMGTHYTPKSSGEQLPKPGFDSTFAEGGKSGVLNNEMIVYHTRQIDPVFLIEFSRKK